MDIKEGRRGEMRLNGLGRVRSCVGDYGPSRAQQVVGFGGRDIGTQHLIVL